MRLSSRFCQRCQQEQRLSKTVHRHDPEAAGIAPCLRSVFPSRHEEEVDPRAANPDRLLLEAADGGHGAVELELTGGGDSAAVVDVPTQLLEDVECEWEPGRGTADVSGVDLDLERELDERRLLNEDADDRPPS